MIYLVRYGQTDWNIKHRTQGQTDIPLNDTGRKQAKILADKIAHLKIAKIISSDLSRAFETAQIITKTIKVPVIKDARLREFSYGDLEGDLGLTITQETWQIFNNEPQKLHAETMVSVFNRVKDLLVNLNKDENILLVTHGGPIQMIMHYLENPQKFDKEKYAITYQFFKINNTDIFELDTSTSKSIKSMSF